MKIITLATLGAMIMSANAWAMEPDADPEEPSEHSTPPRASGVTTTTLDEKTMRIWEHTLSFMELARAQERSLYPDNLEQQRNTLASLAQKLEIVPFLHLRYYTPDSDLMIGKIRSKAVTENDVSAFLSNFRENVFSKIKEDVEEGRFDTLDHLKEMYAEINSISRICIVNEFEWAHTQFDTLNDEIDEYISTIHMKEITLSIASNLLTLGVSNEIISTSTGLTFVEIEQLRATLTPESAAASSRE